MYWRFSVPKIINIGPDLLEIFENFTSVRFFETQCIKAACTKFKTNDSKLGVPLLVYSSSAMNMWFSASAAVTRLNGFRSSNRSSRSNAESGISEAHCARWRRLWQSCLRSTARHTGRQSNRFPGNIHDKWHFKTHFLTFFTTSGQPLNVKLLLKIWLSLRVPKKQSLTLKSLKKHLLEYKCCNFFVLEWFGQPNCRLRHHYDGLNIYYFLLLP